MKQWSKGGWQQRLGTWFAVALAFHLSPTMLRAWDPLPVAQDQRLFMPGSQPGSASLESASRCDNCHGGYDAAVEPAHNWYGSMMAHAARDPLWLACLAVAGQDSIWALGNPNAGDLCIRCHTPQGWLGGRSDPPNASLLSGSDFEGVTCDACHTMLDPFNGLQQQRDLPAETNALAISMASQTEQRDFTVLQEFLLFDGAAFFDPTTALPTHYQSGAWPDYVEATGGQFFVDAGNFKRGPRFDADPTHSVHYSRFHRSRYFCSTCHDVSNPALAHLVHGAGTAERQAAGSYFHVERTWSEFQLSAYARPGGAQTAARLADAGVAWADSCQSCHMRKVTGKACNKSGVAPREDLRLHDLSGGNTWMLGILASLDPHGPVHDPGNLEILSGEEYPGARIDVSGLRRRGQALLDGQARALRQLQLAADLVLVEETADTATLRIQNNTGHKLISGFPEGRRMWLHVQFYDRNGLVLAEINPYEPLVVETTSEDDVSYVSGGLLHVTREDLVYEAKLSSSLTGEDKTFHFVLATGRYKDNRIPPRGFDIARAPDRLVQPVWNQQDAPDYFTAEEYAGGYDEVTLAKPAGTAGWRAYLFYQTTSKEYVEFLRDEIDGSNPTLPSPTLSGEEEAYVIQTDPFFANLRDWGRALWDLWLSNAGSGPVLMTSLAGSPTLLSPLHATDGFHLRFMTLEGQTYQVQRTSAVPSDDWVNVGPALPGDGTLQEVVDPFVGEISHRFYRVVMTPAATP